MTETPAKLPVVCVKCHRVFRTIEVHRDISPDATTSGVCPDCEPELLGRIQGLFGITNAEVPR
jgi:hypothetical protein